MSRLDTLCVTVRRHYKEYDGLDPNSTYSYFNHNSVFGFNLLKAAGLGRRPNARRRIEVIQLLARYAHVEI